MVFAMYSKDTSSIQSKVSNEYECFEALVKLSDYYMGNEQFEASVACAQLAASQAFFNHCGLFASDKLENILRTIGCKTVGSGGNVSRKKPIEPKHVLHVLNAARHTGGDTRYVWRWIQEDPERTHSVALTRQGRQEIPQLMTDAVSQAGGALHVIDKDHSSIISGAKELRRIAEHVDLIVLHLFPDDITPIIAFGDGHDLPPTVFINHSDHTFWLGVSISNIFVHLRDCSLPLSQERRGIPLEKIVFLPTPLGSMRRELSQSEAKKQLGFSEDTIILLTIATAFKYESIGESSFVDIVTPVLQKHKNAILLAVGPDYTEIWQKGHDNTNGRILTYGQRSDTACYYQAADIYIDSFPFSSITSLLEAGSFGLPVVTYCRYSEEAKILGAGAPGLSGVMFQSTSLDSFEETLTQLIDDKPFRLAEGERTKINILEHHCGNGWRRQLHELYAKTCNSAEISSLPIKSCEYTFSEIDMLLNRLYSQRANFGGRINQYIYLLSYVERVRILLKLLKFDHSFSFSMFLPDWLGKRVSGHLRWFRSLPGVFK